MRKTSLRIEGNRLILGKKTVDNLPPWINTLKEYTENWGIPPKAQLLSALVRAGAIIEEPRQAQTQALVIVNGDDFMTSMSFNLDIGYPTPSKIFLYGRNRIAVGNDERISFSSWIRGTEKRIKKGRVIFYSPSITPEGHWAIGLPREFRERKNLYSLEDVKIFLLNLLKI
ncbi:hypothetical protein [Desulforamulus ruminis]|uniref:Uncharacterized protein n=1 Tax=Desulforamulus ruminis (strain ATCC 23193 / DSM 2154 / NCIMB 8452 / DL) TaxID=696281 RepID=F6DTX0_DESRL|nr:hypothetical protein [Desulforamulus ruminis]AEG58988.1 hypothetical protein Desru_0704 [Desulforamulus ruminis DSM 2154]